MKPLKIEPTSSTPSVLFDKGNRVFRIEGNCYPTKVVPFFDPLLFWIQGYIKDPNPVTVIDIRLNYISSNSLKQLLIILKSLIPLKETHQVMINWYRIPEDDDMEERGEFLMEMTGLPFNFILSED